MKASLYIIIAEISARDLEKNKIFLCKPENRECLPGFIRAEFLPMMIKDGCPGGRARIRLGHGG